MEKTNQPEDNRMLEDGATNQNSQNDQEHVDHSPETPEHHTRPIEEARSRLKALSAGIRDKVGDGKFSTVNEALLDLYQDDTNQEFRTYNDWLKEGNQVRKGEKGLLLWGKPKERPQKEEEKNKDVSDGKEMS